MNDFDKLMVSAIVFFSLLLAYMLWAYFTYQCPPGLTGMFLGGNFTCQNLSFLPSPRFAFNMSLIQLNGGFPNG